jgi:hypothetical protein
MQALAHARTLRQLVLNPASMGLLALLTCGCGGENEPVSACADFEPMDPTTLDVDARVITTSEQLVRNGTSIEPSLIADDSGVYWNDYRGGVFVQRRDQSDVITLREGAAPGEDERDVARVLGLAVDSEQIYVGEAYLQGSKASFLWEEFNPPSRLVSIPKQGGAASVLLEDRDATLSPVAVDGGRLIVKNFRGGAEWYQVDLVDPVLYALPIPAPVEAVVYGGQLYWGEGSVMRARFDDTEPELVTRLTIGRLAAPGPGYFLSLTQVSSDVGVFDTLFKQEQASSCARAFPRTSRGLRSIAALDSQHFYYFEGRDVGARFPDQDLEFIRGDVQSWAPARLRAPGIRMVYDAAIIGQDDENLYVHNGASLLAIRRPTR